MISATKISIAALLVSLSSFLLGGVQYYSARKDKLPAPGFDCQLVDSALKLREGGFYDYIEIPSRCTIRNLGSFAFTVDSVIPITFDGLSNITFDRGLDQLQLDYYNKGFDPSQIRLASLEFPIEVKPRSLTRFEMGVLVPLFFYGEKETDKLERREKFAACMSKDVDSVSCTSEVAGLPIVNHLYGGAQIPVPHVGHSEVNGVGVKITLFNGSSLVDEVDIRGLYNWTTDPLIKGLSNNPFIYDPIEKALPAIK